MILEIQTEFHYQVLRCLWNICSKATVVFVFITVLWAYSLSGSQYFIFLFQVLCSEAQISWCGASIISPTCSRLDKPCSLFWATVSLLSCPLNVCCLRSVQGDCDDSQRQCIFYSCSHLSRSVHFVLGVLGQLSGWESLPSFPLRQDCFSLLKPCHRIFCLSHHSACPCI